MNKSKKKSRLTIGFLIDTVDTPYHLNILSAINDALQEKDANLICFQGGFISDDRNYYTTMNKLFDFANSNYLDGIIVLGTTVFRTARKQKILQFYNKFKDLPIVNIGEKIEGIPNIQTDNKAGMKKLIDHLIHHHHFKKIAFIKGREGVIDTQERLEAYIETLKANQMEIDKKMIVPGDFLTSSGIEAVKMFLDERKMRPDAIIASNDHMAMGAIEELARRGIQVPFDMAVTGFDNIELSQYSLPPITTVSQPYRELGRTAADILFDLIEKKAAPESVLLPTELIIRDSCSYLCSAKRVNPVPAGRNPDEKHLDHMMEYLRTANPLLKDQNSIRPVLENIINAFLSSIENNNRDDFFRFLNKMISDKVFENNEMFGLHSLIDSLRNTVLPSLTDAGKKALGEDICNHSLIIFTRQIAKNQILVYDELSTFQQTLNSIHQGLYMALKTREQIKILEKRLPELGIKSAFLSLFTNRKETRLKTAMVYDESGAINTAKSKEITAGENLIPEGLPLSGRRVTYIIELLVNQGIIAVEMVPIEKSVVYRSLREHLWIAFGSSKLFSELQEQKNNLSANLKELRMAMEGYLETMALILEARDPYTAGHQRRVSDLARSIAAEMRLSDDQIECIRMAGIVHDLGKIRIPAEILNKPSKLSDIEFALIKDHPAVAYKVLQNIDFPWPLAEVVYQHHERIDGSGYPLGLKGEKMRVEAKILSVADVIEAMASYRPYRPALGIEKALEEIIKNKGILYDPAVVEACLKLFNIKGYKFIDNK